MNIQSISSLMNAGSSATMQAVTQKVAGGGKSAGGGGGAGIAQSSSSSSSSDTSTTYDKMDLNKDGTVTAAERMQYLMTHPEEAFQNSTNSYNNQGNQSENTGGISGLINLTA